MTKTSERLWEERRDQRVFVHWPYKPIGYGLDGWGVRVRVPVGAGFLSSSHCPDQFCDPPSLLSNEYWGCFHWGLSVKLTTHLQLMQRSRICGSTYPLPHMSSWHRA
jgi:hypothetical protein